MPGRAPRPEHAGVKRHRNHRQFQILRHEQKARLILLRGSRFHPVSFGENNDRAFFFHPFFGRRQHFLHGPRARAAVDRDQPVQPLRPAEERNIGQFLFQNHHPAGNDGRHCVSFQRRFVLAGINRTLLINILPAAHFNLNTAENPQSPQSDPQQQPVPKENHPLLRHKPAEHTGRYHAESDPEINPDCSQPRTNKKHFSPPSVCRCGF